MCANLFTKKITSTDYGDLATLSETTFTEGTKYLGEVRGGMLIVREGSNGKGFIIEDGDRFDFTYRGDTIYVKTNSDGITLNLAE